MQFSSSERSVFVEYLMFSLLLGRVLNQETCNSSLTARNLTGQVIIAGLFPLEYYDTKRKGFVLNNVAVTWVEAFLFAIKLINDDQTILPGISLGYDIRNSCNEEEIALRNVLDFRLDINLLDQRPVKPPKQNRHAMCRCGVGRNRILAVVGGASSSISTSVSNVLSVDNVPQISYSSTSESLSDKEKYPNFFRTLPNDIYQAKAIAELLKFFNWTFVNILASDDDYGRLGLYSLEAEMKKRRMCVAEVKIFKRSLPSVQLQEIVKLLERGMKRKAHVVVLWCQINEAKIILEESWKNGLRGLTWIGCESLGTNNDLFGLGGIVSGFLGVKPTLTKVKKFEHHLENLTPSTHARHNPWLEHYWKSSNHCQLGTSSSYSGNRSSCSNQTGRKLPRSKYSHVISAVYAISLALNSTLAKSHGILSSVKAKNLLQEIKNVKYMDTENNIRISFDSTGDPDFASYTFTNIQGSAKDSTLQFVDVGIWNGDNGKINIFASKLVFPSNQTHVTSHCSDPCSPGTYKLLGEIICCWNCIPCKKNSFSLGNNASSCTPCPSNSISNKNRTACIELEELFFSSDKAVPIAVVSTASFAIFCDLFIIILFFKFWNTPVVKSSNRELSMIQLLFLAISFSYPINYWLKPSVLHCQLQPVWLSLCTTVVVSIILVKTYRLLRIFNKETTEESKILKNRYQTIFVLGFVVIQVLIIVSWLSYNKIVVVKTVFKGKQSFIQHCCGNSSTLLVISQSYILLMSLASAYMAFRARNLPDAFNEARYISFAAFIYCVTWLCAIPLYASLDIIAKYHVICATNTIGSLALLVCLYAFKARIILFLPDQNTRHFFTRQATQNHFNRAATFSGSITSLQSLGLNQGLFQVRNSSPQTKHLSLIASGAVTISKAQYKNHLQKRLEDSPKDILKQKFGRERSITID